MRTAAKWDTAEFLVSDEDVVAYLNAALEDGDQALVAAALGNIARARGMTQLAKETGITRDGLYKALSPDGNPSFNTVQRVVKALGLKLDVAVPV
ncbi:MAG: putative addiction module antidote protein [Coriobacteriales bacterium]|jgi:probable addiction module antidote protein|nr:putative addiction module antidote protein [Coriobacteriales bacterium]